MHTTRSEQNNKQQARLHFTDLFVTFGISSFPLLHTRTEIEQYVTSPARYSETTFITKQRIKNLNMRKHLKLLLGTIYISLLEFTLSFSIAPIFTTSHSDNALLQANLPSSKSASLLEMSRKISDYDDEDDEDEYQYARVRRRRGRFADDYEEEVASRRTESSSSSTRTKKYDQDYDEIKFDEDEFFDNEDEYDDEYDDDDDEFEDIIPNALLDQIDPDGAIDRLPELFSDPKFWKDSAIWFFLGFLYLLNRFNNPMLNGVVDLDKVDFTQFYGQNPPPM